MEFILAKRGLRFRLFHKRGADLLAELDELDLAHRREAGAGRDEVTHDHVFLEAAQIVDLAQSGRFGQDARRVLERRRGNEAVGLERRLGDAEQHRGRLGGLAALLHDFGVFFLELELVDLVAPEERGIARIGDLHLAQHLADDDLDVLVVDLDALETVNFLHFVHEVLLQVLRSADLENLVRHDWAFGQLLAFLHEVALEDDDVLVRAE